MSRTIKFALELRAGQRARTLEEIKTYFDLEKMIGYFLDGRLQNWLESRRCQKEQESLAVLEKDHPDFFKKFCEVFNVDYDGVSVDLTAIENNLSKMKKIQQYTAEKEILQSIDQVACTQEELVELLHKGLKRIYLCGEAFCVPEYWENICYIGVSEPRITVDNKKETFLYYHPSLQLKGFMDEVDCQKSKLFFRMGKEFLQNRRIRVYHPTKTLKKYMEEPLCEKSKTIFERMKRKKQEDSTEEKRPLTRIEGLKKKNISFENVRM